MATTREEAKVGAGAGARLAQGQADHAARLRLDEAELRASIDGMLNRHPAVGQAVGVVRDGSTAVFHGRGLAEITSGTPIDIDTVFRIGSVTKPFTAIAVMQLWEQARRRGSAGSTSRESAFDDPCRVRPRRRKWRAGHPRASGGQPVSLVRKPAARRARRRIGLHRHRAEARH